MRTGSTLNFLLGDHLGSTSIVTDASGNKVSEMRYKAWGEVRYNWGSIPTDYQFTGQYSHQSDFGLMFYNARYYDSSLGRFASPDTIIPEQSQGVQAWDRYAYVNNSPIGNIDPSGHSLPLPPCWLCGLTLSYASSSGLFEEGGALNSVLDMAIPLAGDLLYPGGVDVDPLADTVTFASSEEYYSAQVNSIAAFGVDVVPLEPFFPMTPFDGVIETKSVYYTQDSAKKLFSNGESWIDLAEGLGNGTIDPSSIPPIRIFKDANGKIWTLDNRRLAAFEYAGVDIPYTSITASTVQKESWKFTTQNGGASIRIRDTNLIVSK